MMRIVVDGAVYGHNAYGGIARYWTEILKLLVREKSLHLDLAVARDGVWPSGVPCCAIGSPAAYWSAWRADLFHSTYYSRWPRVKCPSVATAYDFIDASFPLLRPNGHDFVGRQFDVLRRASAVMVISKSTRELAIQLARIDPARIFLAYPAVPSPFSLPPPAREEVAAFRQKLTGGAPYLLHVGERMNYKNFRTILDAYCRGGRSTDRHLVVMGGRHPLTHDELHTIVSHRLLDRIHFHPRTDDATLRLAYAGADALVHASLMEGFGIPVIEALACGTGLILSDIPVYREIASGMATLIEPTDVDRWTGALAEPVAIQSGWREEVLRRYTWEAAAQAHLQAYRSVRA